MGGLKHIISTKQFLDTSILENLFLVANQMENEDKNKKIKQTLKGKILASLFYEPSTRTRFSFEVAIQKLGGKVITTESASHFSSVTKGESLQDTIKILQEYADVIILRHNKEGSAQIAADVSSVPIINAGDGAGEHPTQALLDIYTIKKEKGKINDLNIALVGDLLYGRTVHSLLNLLSLYSAIKIYLVSPPELKLPQKYKDVLIQENIQFEEVEDIKKILNKIDVIYVTRIQRERFLSQKEYEQVKGSYIINKEVIKSLKEDAIIMHPLPRVDEISPEVDDDKRAAYFRQARNGLYLRMALLHMLFNGELKQRRL
ncbi:MAG: aspartate carbamoyltransferase [Candidatus Woesearchaeota archaeon]|nr:MAG: aspartate carbamoyltransferase [Candidatus Woesearchaeota archaeon]